MSILVSEVYEALLDAGASEQKAKAAAAAVPIGANLATKQDIVELRADMAEYRAADHREMAEYRAADRKEMAEYRAADRKETAEVRKEMAEMRKDIEVLKMVVFRFLLPAQLLIIGLAVKAAFFPG